MCCWRLTVILEKKMATDFSNLSLLQKVFIVLYFSQYVSQSEAPMKLQNSARYCATPTASFNLVEISKREKVSVTVTIKLNETILQTVR